MPKPLTPLQLQAQSTQFARQHLVVLSGELLQMQDTGVLPDGRVRELVKMCAQWAGGADAQSVAESLVKREALRAASGVMYDIELAPRDGTRIVMAHKDWEDVCVGYWSADDAAWRAVGAGVPWIQPTHWSAVGQRP